MLATAVAGLVFVLCGSPAMARATTPGERYVQSLAEDIMRLARSGAAPRQLEQRFIALLNRHANIPGVALFALGPYRNRLPAARRARYNRLVLDYVAGLFVSYVNEFSGTSFEIRSSFPSGQATIVDTRILFAARPAQPVRWRIAPAGGSFLVTDVNVRGVWLSLQLRSQFTSVLKRHDGDIEALLRFLEQSS